MSALATTPKPAGSRRFWVTVLCFAIANAGAWVLWHRAHAPGRRDLLRVEQFDPGDGADVGPRAELAWRFNLDVGRAGEDVEGAAPAVGHARGGRAVALGGRAHARRSFPTQDLPRATRVKFTLSPQRLRTADGFALAGPFESSVVTTPLRVHRRPPGGVRGGGPLRPGIRVQRPRAAGRRRPRRWASPRPTGGPVQCHAVGQAADRVVRVTTDPVVAAVGSGRQPGAGAGGDQRGPGRGAGGAERAAGDARAFRHNACTWSRRWRPRAWRRSARRGASRRCRSSSTARWTWRR